MQSPLEPKNRIQTKNLKCETRNIQMMLYRTRMSPRSPDQIVKLKITLRAIPCSTVLVYNNDIVNETLRDCQTFNLTIIFNKRYGTKFVDKILKTVVEKKFKIRPRETNKWSLRGRIDESGRGCCTGGLAAVGNARFQSPNRHFLIVVTFWTGRNKNRNINKLQ